MEPVASAARASQRAKARPEERISRGELRCRVEAEGIGRVAERLATRVDLLHAAIRGELRLRPERVLALRLDADLRALVDAFTEQRLQGSAMESDRDPQEALVDVLAETVLEIALRDQRARGPATKAAPSAPADKRASAPRKRTRA